MVILLPTRLHCLETFYRWWYIVIVVWLGILNAQHEITIEWVNNIFLHKFKSIQMNRLSNIHTYVHISDHQIVTISNCTNAVKCQNEQSCNSRFHITHSNVLTSVKGSLITLWHITKCLSAYGDIYVHTTQQTTFHIISQRVQPTHSLNNGLLMKWTGYLVRTTCIVEMVLQHSNFLLIA